MDFKDLIALAFFAVATPLCVVACCISRYVREAAFFLMIALLPLVEPLSVNFDSHFWYRGTTRGFEFTCLDVLAIGLLIGSFFRPKPGYARWFWPASLGWMLIFFIYACANVAWSSPKIYGMFELSKMARGIIFFLAAAIFVRGRRELTILVVALCLDAMFEGALGIKEKIEGNWRVPGTLDDPNSLSMYLCTIAPVFVAATNSDLPRFVRQLSIAALLAASCGIVLTVSRAGIPIFIFVVCMTAAACVSWRITIKKIYAGFFLLFCLGILFYAGSNMIERRWSGDSFRHEYYGTSGIDSRGYYLRLMNVMVRDNFWGVGLNNWSYWASKKYAAGVLPYEPEDNYDDLPTTPQGIRNVLSGQNFSAPAHCLAALTAGELGIPGLILFAFLWLRWFRMGFTFLWPRTSAATRRMGVGFFFGTCGIFLQSVTEWVFHETQIYFTFLAMLGSLAAIYWLRKQELKQRKLEWSEEFEDEVEYEHEPFAVS